MDSAILCGGDNLSIIKPIAQLLGYILDILFKGLNAIGIGNIAIAIIIFTLLVKMLMLPLQIKQQKMTKLQSVMNPEIKAIQEKYKGKNSDTVAMQKMQAETKAVYEKYGVSQWGSCVQLLIQMPILFALYRVFQQIPLYISQIKVLFLNILGLNGADGISSVSGYADTLNEIYGRTVDWSNTSTAVTTLNSFTSDQWIKLKEAFPAFSDMITQNLDKINHMNTFLGVNMSQNPGFGLHIAILIPILAGVTQFISVKVSQAGMEQPDSDNPAAASMKMMTYVMSAMMLFWGFSFPAGLTLYWTIGNVLTYFMPLMSAFLAISLPSGLGVYWIATAVIQTIQTIFINRYYDKIGTDKIVEKNVEKRNKKRAKKGLPAETIVKGASVSTKNVNNNKNSSASSSADRAKKLQERKEANDKKIQELKEAAAASGKAAKPGSLADKVGMVSRYNEVNDKRK